MSSREEIDGIVSKGRTPGRVGFLLAALLCTGLGGAAYQLRVAWIASFFVDRTPLAKDTAASLSVKKERIHRGDPLRDRKSVV